MPGGDARPAGQPARRGLVPAGPPHGAAGLAPQGWRCGSARPPARRLRQPVGKRVRRL